MDTIVSCLIQDDVDDRIDIGDIHLTIAIDIGAGAGLARFHAFYCEYHINDGVDIGNIDLAVTVNVPINEATYRYNRGRYCPGNSKPLNCRKSG